MKLVGKLLTFCLVLQSSLFACQCFFSGSCKNPFRQATTIFLGTAAAKSVADGRGPNGTFYSPVPAIVTFTVKEAFQGATTAEVKVHTTEGCCACGYQFEVGQSYLVFANEHQGRLTTSKCTPTRTETEAGALLAQLRSQSGADIFGLVGFPPQYGLVEPGRFQPLAGISVRLVDETGREFSTTTDSLGAYEFKGLAPGTYEIGPILRQGLLFDEKTAPSRSKISVVEAGIGCEKNLPLYADITVSGKIRDNDSRPAEGFILITPVGTKFWSSDMGLGEEIAADGSFTLRVKWPGNYYFRFTPRRAGKPDLAGTCILPARLSLKEGTHLKRLPPLTTCVPPY